MHRDIKPHNILLDLNWKLKLSDFGEAVRLDFSHQSHLVDKELALRFGSFCGTPLYVSPEMLQDCVTCIGNDLWALGVIMF